MASLSMSGLRSLFVRSAGKNTRVSSSVARTFAKSVYKGTGGPTTGLKQVYDKYRENQERGTVVAGSGPDNRVSKVR